MKTDVSQQLLDITADKIRAEEAINFKATFLETEFQELSEKFGHPKNGTEVWVKSIKIDKICDVMWWTSGSSGFISAL